MTDSEDHLIYIFLRYSVLGSIYLVFIYIFHAIYLYCDTRQVKY